MKNIGFILFYFFFFSLIFIFLFLFIYFFFNEIEDKISIKLRGTQNSKNSPIFNTNLTICLKSWPRWS